MGLTNTWAHPDVCQSQASSIQESHPSDRSTFLIKVDYEPFVLKGDDVLRLDVDVGNTVAMQKCDALHQLATEIRNLAEKHPESAGRVKCSRLGDIRDARLSSR